MGPLATTAVLHYVFDPLCGWCYAAAPLLRAAQDLPGLRVALHGGGMMTGPNRRTVTPQWREYVIPHDKRIAQLTGQPFGLGYFDGLLNDLGATMDSAPPTTAVLAADALEGRGLAMLERLQRAHYVEGRRIAERPVLDALAADLALPAEAFAATFDALEGTHTQTHIEQSRGWLHRLGGQGFPTLALEIDGRFTPLDVGVWLGRAQAWAGHLAAHLDRGNVAGRSATQNTPACALPATGAAVRT